MRKTDEINVVAIGVHTSLDPWENRQISSSPNRFVSILRSMSFSFFIEMIGMKILCQQKRTLIPGFAIPSVDQVPFLALFKVTKNERATILDHSDSVKWDTTS